MNIFVQKDVLIKPLLLANSIIDRKQLFPILSNIMIHLDENILYIVSTDMEIEIKFCINVEGGGKSERITVPARKLLDICRTFDDRSSINIKTYGSKAEICSGKSRYILLTLPPNDYPSIDTGVSLISFTIKSRLIKELIKRTQFAIAQQDIRYYLNGMLIHIRNGYIKAVATDGHRLAVSEFYFDELQDLDFQVIVPRKSVIEIEKALSLNDSIVKVDLSGGHIKFSDADVVFTTKLIDGKFPEYQKIISQEMSYYAVVCKSKLIQVISRASILTNDKNKGVRLTFSNNNLVVLASNTEQEEAEEQVDINYTGPTICIGFNYQYLLSALDVISGDNVNFGIKDPQTSVMLFGDNDMVSKYVIMPMRI